LRAEGLRLYEIALISDLGAARRQIVEVAAVLGHPERGEKLLADIDAARARLHAAPKPPFHTALLVNRGGYTAGERSLASALLAEAGLVPPPGAPPGYGGYVPLERLLMLRPDVIVLNNLPSESDQGSYNLSHPALAALYPARPATFAGTNFLPHHEPTMMSGAAAITSSADTMRSFAFLFAARAGKTSMPPAASINSDTHWMPEIIGSSHSSK